VEKNHPPGRQTKISGEKLSPPEKNHPPWRKTKTSGEKPPSPDDGIVPPRYHPPVPVIYG
jgi:hypothetical protein